MAQNNADQSSMSDQDEHQQKWEFYMSEGSMCRKKGRYEEAGNFFEGANKLAIQSPVLQNEIMFILEPAGMAAEAYVFGGKYEKAFEMASQIPFECFPDFEAFFNHRMQISKFLICARSEQALNFLKELEESEELEELSENESQKNCYKARINSKF